MQRKIKMLGTVLAASVLAASTAITAAAAPVTEESAKALALANTGLTADSVLYITAKADHDDGRQIYEVELLTGNYMSYEFEINAADGAVLHVDCEWDGAPRAAVGTQATVTPEQARALAIAHAGLTADAVTFEKAKTDLDDGQIIYELKFYTADRKEYEYEIDAVTGNILKWEYDATHYTPVTQTGNPAPSQNQNTSSGAISGIEAAKAAALKQAGLSSANVRWGKVKPDYEDGRLVYEGEFYHNNLEYEFEIDAATGAIVDWDVDEDD